MLDRLISWLDTSVILDLGKRVGGIYHFLLTEVCKRLINGDPIAVWEMPREPDGSVDPSTATEFIEYLGQMRNHENVELGPLKQVVMFRSCDDRRPAIYVMGLFNRDHWIPIQEKLVNITGVERTFMTHPETLISKALLGNFDMYIAY